MRQVNTGSQTSIEGPKKTPNLAIESQKGNLASSEVQNMPDTPFDPHNLTLNSDNKPPSELSVEPPPREYERII